MKKILILLLLVFNLSGCFKNEINSSVYISSIGFEVEEGKIKCYFLSNPLNNISRNSSGEGESEYIKIEASSVEEGFKNAEKSLLLPPNYRHIKSVIFHKSFFESKFLEQFLKFMRSGLYVTYNYYVFATMDKIEDVLKFKNPDQISYQHSILSSPNLIEFEKYGLEQMHFLDFANDYYEKQRYLHVPLISAKEVWNKNVTLEVSGFLAYENQISSFKIEDYPGMAFLKNQEIIYLYTKDATYRILGYKVHNKDENGKFTIYVSYEDVYIFGEGNIDTLEREINKEIKKYLDDYIAKYNGLYLIKEYNYLNKKALNMLFYDINIKKIK